jgi:3-methyl-2-oxobutanoate hydroxymethyltransferase
MVNGSDARSVGHQPLTINHQPFPCNVMELPPLRFTTRDFLLKKERGERIAVVTAYDTPSAVCADAAGVDAILVGDSVGMVALGQESTLPVTLDMMVHHAAAVVRGTRRAMVVVDLPFMSYQVSVEDAMRSAGRLMKEAGVAAVKLEGGRRVAESIRRMTDAGIPVMGHLGLTPQSVHQFGGFRVQGRSTEAARRLLDEARALEEAGVFAVVLELVPDEVAAAITRMLRVPTIGIGAGPRCNGEVQVFHDLLGFATSFTPRHTRRYAEIGTAIRDALQQYVEDVRAGRFPAEENTVHQADLEGRLE